MLGWRNWQPQGWGGGWKGGGAPTVLTTSPPCFWEKEQPFWGEGWSGRAAWSKGGVQLPGVWLGHMPPPASWKLDLLTCSYL